MSISRKNFFVVCLTVALPTTVIFMLATSQDLWLWAILISAGLGLLSALVLTSAISRIIKMLYISGYIFAIGVGTFSSFPPVTIPVSGAYMGLAVAAIGAVASRRLQRKWLAIVMIVSGAGVGIAYYMLLGTWIFLPLLWGFKLPYCAAVGALAAYMGYQMLIAPRDTAPMVEPPARVDIAAVPPYITATPRAVGKQGTTAMALLLGVLSVTICTGMAAALGISNLVGKGLFASWESLGVPAGSANQISGASADWVIVQTSEGTNYRLGLGYHDQNAVWVKLDTANIAPTRGCGPLKSTAEKQRFHESYALLSVPSNVIGEPYVVECMAPESISVIVYVVNNQGEVLRWQSTGGLPTLGQALQWGLLGGIVVGLVLAAVLIQRRNQPKQG